MNKIKKITLGSITALVAFTGIAGASGFSKAHASTAPHWNPVTVTGKQWTCTRTNPEYLVNAGGAGVVTQPGTVKFKVVSAQAGGYKGMSAPYISQGYNASLNAGKMCNSRDIDPGPGFKAGKAYAVPVKNGKQGKPVADIHAWTSDSFRGDAGYDMWFTKSPADSTYNEMANGGDGSAEIMIWLNHPGLRTQSTSLKYYPVVIGGRHWKVEAGLASHGHGKSGSHPNGWNVVNFIAPKTGNGHTSVNGLKLNDFASYAIKKGWLKPSSYWMGIHAGFEITHGSASVEGYRLTGLPH